jgi:hypothetical protein
MKRHRYYHLRWQGFAFQALRQQLSQRESQRLQVVVFELVNGLAYQPLQKEKGANTVYLKPPLQTERAAVLLNQRPAALGT